jgi:hypothetical protein
MVDVDHGMDCMREETFGPTLPVMKVRDAQEAIEKTNDSRFGLSGRATPRYQMPAALLRSFPKLLRSRPFPSPETRP